MIEVALVPSAPSQSIVKCRRWVCENHPDRPWGSGHGECCGAAGMPCPDCNEPHDGERPAVGDDFVPAFDRDKGSIN
jgi:hypothetical protein